MNRLSRAILPIVLAFACFGQTPSSSPELRRTRLDMIFTSSLLRTANRNDSTVAIRLWGNMIGRKRGFQFDSTVEIVDDAPSIKKRLQTGSFGVVGTDAIEYFKIADIPTIEPMFYAQIDSRMPLRFLILVRADSAISSVASLRGKSLILFAGTGANLGKIWFDSLLYDARLLEQPQKFLGSIEAVNKSSAAILPLFFGKVDAAIVDQSSFDVMREMNPQVGQRLRILATSPALLEGVVSVGRGHEFRQDLIDGMRDLHLDPEGKQLLTVFRFGRLMPFDRELLNQVQELWRKHALLLKMVDPPHGASLSRVDSLSGRGDSP